MHQIMMAGIDDEALEPADVMVIVLGDLRDDSQITDDAPSGHALYVRKFVFTSRSHRCYMRLVSSLANRRPVNLAWQFGSLPDVVVIVEGMPTR